MPPELQAMIEEAKYIYAAGGMLAETLIDKFKEEALKGSKKNRMFFIDAIMQITENKQLTKKRLRKIRNRWKKDGIGYNSL